MPSSHTALRVSLALLGVALAGSCASKGRDEASGAPPVGRIITAEQIEATGAASAWEALKFTVRTHYFADYRGQPVRIYADRGQGSMVLREEPQLYLDGARLTDITILRMIPADNLLTIQVITGPDATTYFGTNAVAGVILLETTMGAGAEEDSAWADTTGATLRNRQGRGTR